jgi:hypothetical protein
MAAARDSWVTCDEYAAGPFTPEVAERKAGEIARSAAAGEPHACHLGHRIVTSDVAPVPAWKRALEGEH